MESTDVTVEVLKGIREEVARAAGGDQRAIRRDERAD